MCINLKGKRILVLSAILYSLNGGIEVGLASEQCSLLLRPPFSEWSDDELIVQTQKNLANLLSILRQSTEMTHNNRLVQWGMPGKELRLSYSILSKEEVSGLIFRHYSTSEGVRQIAQSRRLRAGAVPYVNSPYVYPDLSGIFLTLPEYAAEEVGLDSSVHTSWIDLRVDPDIAVIRLEPSIYLIPGSGPVPEWLRKNWIAQESNLKSESELSRDLERRRAIGASAMEIPILKIEQHSE